MNYVAVFCGGLLGSLLRDAIAPGWPAGSLTTDSFTVNVIACLTIGLLYGTRSGRIDGWLPFAATGFCGGLSTFSLFAAQVHALLTGAGAWQGLGAAGIEILAGIGAAALGYATGNALGNAPGSAPGDATDATGPGPPVDRRDDDR